MITHQSIGLDERLDQGREVATVDTTPVLAPVSAQVQPVTLETIIENHQMNGALLAFRLKEMLEHYADFPRQSDAILTTLWIISTWLREPGGGLAFRVHPRWFAIGPSGSGKSRMLEEIDAMCYRSSGPMQNVTSAFVRDAIADDETVLLEEAQRLFQRGGGKMEIQSALTAHKETARSGNGRGGLNNRSMYGPMAVAARPSIIHATGGLKDGVLADLFRRALPLITTEPASRIIPDQDESWDMLTDRFAMMLTAWGSQNSPKADDEHPRPRLWAIHTDQHGNPLPGITDGGQREISMAYLATADRLVSPRVIAETGKDVRWAQMARDAIGEAFRGKADNGPDLMAQIEEQFRAAGISMEEHK